MILEDKYTYATLFHHQAELCMITPSSTCYSSNHNPSPLLGH